MKARGELDVELESRPARPSHKIEEGDAIGGRQRRTDAAEVDVEESVRNGVVGCASPPVATLTGGARRGRSQAWPAPASREGVKVREVVVVEVGVVEVCSTIAHTEATIDQSVGLGGQRSSPT